jgi:group II intron reverse transcriptase/maturase
MSELLEKILSRENMAEAFKRVCANKGSAGTDGVSIEEAEAYVRDNWAGIKKQIQQRQYRPQPVRRVEIPKPNGGKRKLGIPTVMDRTIQQAVTQVIAPICEPYFSDSSYGFRPGRSCEQAILKLLDYFNDGYEWIVDIDLEKFFDNVPQDRLMSLVHVIINDGDTESLIRKYLQAGVMVNGRYEETNLGTPQGGNLSPLLSNIMLNELDKELDARGLRFTRYADDCVIVVKSESSAKRVMRTITDYIERKLGLKVNATKTHVTRPNDLKYLGFGFWKGAGKWQARPHKDSVAKFQRKLKQLCERRWNIPLDQRITKLNQVIRGWINYFSIGSMKVAMKKTDEHLRTMIRVIIWKQWKKPSKRLWGLKKLGVPARIAERDSQWGDHYQFTATRSSLKRAVSKQVLSRKGLVSCLDYYLERHDLKFN